MRPCTGILNGPRRDRVKSAPGAAASRRVFPALPARVDAAENSAKLALRGRPWNSETLSEHCVRFKCGAEFERVRGALREAGPPLSISETAHRRSVRMSRLRYAARADARKSKDELIEEIESLRRRLGELERVGAGERTGSFVPLTEWLQQVYREAPIGLCYFDRNLRYVFINNFLAELNGISVEEHLGRSIREVIPDVATGVEAQLRHVIETGEPIVGGEVGAETPAHPGFIKSFQHHYYGIKSEAGTVLGVACVVQEITARKQAEEALRESEERLKLIMNAVPAGISYFDREQRFRFANEQYESLLGLKPSELIGKTLEEAIGKKSYKVAHQYVQRALSGQTASFENTLPAKNGGKISIAVSYVPDIGPDRTVKGFFALVHDITERKQAEAALRESEDRLRRSVLDAPIPIMIHAEDGEVLMISRKWSELSGYSHADIPTIFDWTEKAYGADKEKMRGLIGGLYEIQEPFEDEAYVTTAWGERRIWDFRTAPLGRLMYGRRFVTSMAVDITERKAAEEALRESEERLSAFIYYSPTAISLKDRDGRFIRFNPVCERLVGRREEEVVGKTTHDLFDKIDKAYLDSSLAQDRMVLDEGRVVQREVTLELEDGVHTLHMNKFPIRDATGTIVAIGSESVDITARKAAEQALRESEEKFRTVLDHSPAKIHIKDLQGRYLLINKTAEALFGVTDQEARGKTTHEIFPKERADVFTTHDRDVSETMEVVEEEEEWLLEDGVHTFLTVKFPIRDVSGEAVAVGAIGTDITEHKRLARQHIHAEKMEALGVLAGGIAHEFNNMLFAIIGLTESVVNVLPEGGEERANLEGVLEAGERAGDLVQQILAFGRRDETRPRVLDLQNVLSSALKLVRATLPTTIEIHQSLDAACGPVLADPTHIHQILLNLGSNAADAMREKGGLLDVRLDRVVADDRLMTRFSQLAPGPYARLTVRDTGSGMDERTLGRIFDPFFTTKDRDAGTGMGLAAVHGIVSGYRGAIDASSKPGRGTTFEIYLPIWAGENEEDPRGGRASGEVVVDGRYTTLKPPERGA